MKPLRSATSISAKPLVSGYLVGFSGFAMRSRSNSSPATSTGRASSARSTSARAANTGVLSSCRSRLYASGSDFTVASRPLSLPIAVPALPRASSATSAFSFCGIIDEPVAASSGSFAKPNSVVVQSTISSPMRERWVQRTAPA